MKTLGIIAGMSWESSIEYYRLINEGVHGRLGGVHSAKLVLSSVDFQGFSDDMAAERWDRVEADLLFEAERLAGAAVDGLLIATNTMHLFADSVMARTGLPLLHIADAVGGAIRKTGHSKVGLLGTRYAMEKGFYVERLASRFGIEAIVPEEAGRLEVNRIIFQELCVGVFDEGSKRRLLDMIGELRARGAEGVILGCTELPLIIKQKDLDFPVWDSLGLHAKMAVDFILEA